MADIIPWVATAATVIAAIITASNLGTRITGFGFCVFLVGSLAWIAAGIVKGDQALLVTNLILTLTNIFGIWRWLGRQSTVEKGAASAARKSKVAASDTLFPVDLLAKAEVRLGDEKIGQCVNAMASCSDGRIDYVVVTSGGVGGVGETLRRIDWNDLSVHDDHVQTSLTATQLAQLPELERDQWPER